MKKFLLSLVLVASLPLMSFSTSSSMAVEDQTDCDAEAESWYNQTLAGGYSQRDATRVYLMVHEDCFMNGGDSSFTANP